MGFYGNILTTDAKVQSQIEELKNSILSLRYALEHQDFVIDGNLTDKTDNNIDLSLTVNDLERRLEQVENSILEIQEVIGQLCTELIETHKLLISAQEALEWPNMPSIPSQGE